MMASMSEHGRPVAGSEPGDGDGPIDPVEGDGAVEPDPQAAAAAALARARSRTARTSRRLASSRAACPNSRQNVSVMLF